MTTADIHRPEPTFRDVGGRPVHQIVAHPDATTKGATVIPDVAGLDIPAAAAVYRAHDLAVGPWRLVDGGKNLGAYVGRGYHQLAATLTPDQARELCALDSAITGMFLSAGRSGLAIFDVDRPELCPELLRRAIDELEPPFQTTRDAPARPGEVARGHYVFRVPEGRRMGSPSKWQVPAGGETWGEVRSWNSGIAIGPGLHPKADQGGRYEWARTGAIPELPPYLAVTLPEYMVDASPATRDEMRKLRAAMKRRTDPAAVGRAVARNSDDDTASGRHGATLQLALELGREMVAGRINYDDFTRGVHEFFYALVTDPTRKDEPARLCEWAMGQVLADAARGAVPGVADEGVPTDLPDGADLTAENVRLLRTIELYNRAEGRPIGLADDRDRIAGVLRKVAQRVAQSPAGIAFIEAVDMEIVPVLVDWSALGNLRAGSGEDKAAEHQQRDDAWRDALAAGVRVIGELAKDEVTAYCAAEGAGVPLNRALRTKWADLTADTLADAVVTGYRKGMAATKTTTPNLDGLSGLSDGRSKFVGTRLGQALATHAAAVVATIAADDTDVPPLPQPRPAMRVPICLDTAELRIDGVNTFLNTWSADPSDVAGNGDLFMFRGVPVLYTPRGGQIAEDREIRPLGAYELIATTNDRADVHEATADGDKVVAELTDHGAKVGLAAVRRTLARTLREVAATPIITPDDHLVPDGTYDDSTGVLVACNTPHRLAPEAPTTAQVRKAMARLHAFYGDVAFMSDGDKAAFWAFMFTVPLRRRLDGDGWAAVPALGVRAGKRNAGKTLVSTAIGALHGMTGLRLPDSEEELHKRLLSAYETKQSAQVLVLNNIPNGAVLDSSALAEVITEPTVEGRKLGHTGHDISHRNNKILIVNGNRWRPHDDLVDRFVPCGIKPVVGVDRRTFSTPDLEQRIQTPQHHAEVLHLLHVVLRAWIADGAQGGDHHGIRGNFRRWAAMADGVFQFLNRTADDDHQITGFGDNFSVFADMDDNPDEDFLVSLVDAYPAGKWFTAGDLESMLIEIDERPLQVQETHGADLVARIERTMWRDARRTSEASRSKGAPLTGRKLAAALNKQLDMPIEREGKPVVVLKASKVQGARGFRFEVA